MRKVAKLGLLLAIGLAPVGCTAVILAGLGAAAYVGHEYFEGGYSKVDFAGDLDTVWNATVAACDKKGYRRTAGIGHGADRGEFQAQSGSDTIYFVVVKKEAQVTRVEVKYGELGNESLSHAILDEIGQILKPPAKK
jgi:hypothetical protein